MLVTWQTESPRQFWSSQSISPLLSLSQPSLQDNSPVADSSTQVEAQAEAAIEAEDEALNELESALRRVVELREEAQFALAQKGRERMIAAYRQLAAKQEDLLGRTRPYLDIPVATRRERATLIDLGYEQADIRIEAGDLWKQVTGVTVFEHFHERIDTSARQVSDQLRDTQVSPITVEEQAEIATWLRTLAVSLDHTQRNDPFATSGNASGAAGGGGVSPRARRTGARPRPGPPGTGPRARARPRAPARRSRATVTCKSVWHCLRQDFKLYR